MNPFIQDVVAEAIKKQSFFQKNANTIVTGIGALAAVLGFVASFELPIKDEWSGIIPAVIGVLTAFAVKLTPNGVQPSTANKLENTVVAQSTLPFDVSGIAAEASRMAPAAQDLASVVQVEAERWLGQAQGVADRAHELAAEHVGRHRGE